MYIFVSGPRACVVRKPFFLASYRWYEEIRLCKTSLLCFLLRTINENKHFIYSKCNTQSTYYTLCSGKNVNHCLHITHLKRYSLTYYGQEVPQRVILIQWDIIVEVTVLYWQYPVVSFQSLQGLVGECAVCCSGRRRMVTFTWKEK